MQPCWSRRAALSLLAVVSVPAEAACNLSMRWGLESAANFREVAQYADETSAVRSDRRQGPRLRAFRMSQAGQQVMLSYL